MSWNNENKNQHNTDNDNKTDQVDWAEKLQKSAQILFDKSTVALDRHYKKILTYSLLALLLVWLGSGIYIIDQGNRGVVTRFGAYLETTLPGPHWHIPMPIEKVAVINVENQRFIEVGYRSNGRQNNARPALPDSLMLTKDENIVSVRLAIQYQIDSARDYLFNVKGNESTLKQVTESIERGVIGRNNMDFILTEGRSQIVNEIKLQVQQAMDLYQSGVRVTSVNLQDAQPPEEVQNSFEDAIRAREDKQRLINEAEAYANEVIPKARGAAARMLQEAEGYEAQVVATAYGESERFDQLLVEYEKNPKITRKRLYLDAKEKLYSSTNKVMVGVENGGNMFYLPLNQLPQANSATSKATASEPHKYQREDSSRDKNRAANSKLRNSRRSRS